MVWKMFPSVSEMVHKRKVSGRVFAFQIDYEGQVAQKSDAFVDREAWQKYLGCSDADVLLPAVGGYHIDGTRGQDVDEIPVLIRFRKLSMDRTFRLQSRESASDLCHKRKSI